MNTSPHDAAARMRFERYMSERLAFELRSGWALDYDFVLSAALWVQLRSGRLYTEPLNPPPVFPEDRAIAIDLAFLRHRQREATFGGSP